MFNNIFSNFNGMFGKVEAKKFRLTLNGNIAVLCSNGSYKTYNVKKGTLTNVTNFCFNVGDEMFFIIPTNKVEVGDIILANGKPKCVIGVNPKTIEVIDYENSDVRTLVPERHIFMGSTYFYGKIVSMWGNMFNNGKGMKNMLKMAMMSQLLNNNDESDNIKSGGMFGMNAMGNFGQMLMMSSLMGGNSNPFGEMLDDMLDMSDMNFMNIANDDDAITPDENVDEVPTKKTSKKNNSKKEE